MRLRRRRDPIAALTAKQPQTLKMAVAEHLRLYPNSDIKVHAVGKQRFRNAGYIPIQLAAEHIDRIEEYIRQEFGGGDFKLMFYDPTGREVANYRVGVEGQVRFKDLDTNLAAGKPSGEGKFLQEIGGEAIKAALNPAAQMQAMAELMKIMQPPAGDESFQKEVFSVILNNFFTNKENEVDKFKELMEMARMLQPTVAPEDPMTAMVTAFAPLLGQLLMAKSGGGMQQALAANPQLQQALAGAISQNAAAPGLQEPGEQQPAPLQTATSPQDPDAAIVDTALLRFREHIKAGTHIDRLTQMFLNMVALAQTWNPEHPMFAPFLVDEAADWTLLSDAFDAFCQKIPELAVNPQIQQDIKVNVATRLMQQEAEGEPDEEEAITVVDTNAQPGPQVLERTEPDHDDGTETGGELESAATVG